MRIFFRITGVSIAFLLCHVAYAQQISVGQGGLSYLAQSEKTLSASGAETASQLLAGQSTFIGLQDRVVIRAENYKASFTPMAINEVAQVDKSVIAASKRVFGFELPEIYFANAMLYQQYKVNDAQTNKTCAAYILSQTLDERHKSRLLNLLSQQNAPYRNLADHLIVDCAVPEKKAGNET